MKPSQSQSVLPFLLEVGCEEIPARFLSEAEKNLGERLRVVLEEFRLIPTGYELQTYSTPRRLVVSVPAILRRQPDKVEEILGPPVKVAFDSQGNPTRAAQSFALKNSVSIDSLVRTFTPKGEYLALRKTSSGRSAEEVLVETLPPVILGLPFPKSMYWVAKSGPRFVRPIRWILALLGEGDESGIVNIEIAGVKSGDLTHGQRLLKSQPLRVTGVANYLKKLIDNNVEVVPIKRRDRIVEESKVLLEVEELVVVPDDWLVDWTVNSVEWPRPLLGRFDQRFLLLPREILITVMRDHQKYFALEDQQGNLQARFLFFLNKDADTRGLIQHGHERVLAARFSDAEFFWNTDQRVRLRDRESVLERVTYQVRLGSYSDKVRRMLSVSESFSSVLERKDPSLAGYAVAIQQAIRLCKCDLTTQMVQEFPELQGIVGGLYAAVQGEPKEIAEAIYDHYLPRSAEDRCPRSLIGAVVSACDKLDSVVGGFAVGLEPTGSSDPFALRRQANGIIKVILEFKIPILLSEITKKALESLNIEWAKPLDVVSSQVLEFLAERLRYYLEAVNSFRYDTVRAVLAAGSDAPYDAFLRAQALHNLRGSANLEALCMAAKRIKNILAKSASQSDWTPGEVNEGILVEEAERELYRTYRSLDREQRDLTTVDDYQAALEAISTLRPFVDTFFDKVLVMAEDKEVRENRLRLLGKLDQMLSGIARFSEIAAEVEAR